MQRASIRLSDERRPERVEVGTQLDVHLGSVSLTLHVRLPLVALGYFIKRLVMLAPIDSLRAVTSTVAASRPVAVRRQRLDQFSTFLLDGLLVLKF